LNRIKSAYYAILGKDTESDSRMDNEFKRSCEDELDWTTVEQLHEATLQISKSCFELKKLCIALIGIAITLVTKLAPTTSVRGYIALTILICLFFWIADTTAYYYQKSTRRIMSNTIKRIAQRNKIKNYPAEPIELSWRKSAINPSMSLYIILILFGLLALLYIKFEASITSTATFLESLI
jgi:hypothetical protein